LPKHPTCAPMKILPFQPRANPSKAPEDWRTPKTLREISGRWRRRASFWTAAVLCRFRTATPAAENETGIDKIYRINLKANKSISDIL
jgi:hypothetical protein